MTRVRIGGRRYHLPSVTTDELYDMLVHIADDLARIGAACELIEAEIDRRKAIKHVQLTLV